MFELNNTNAISPELKKQSQEALKKFLSRKDIGFPHMPDRAEHWDKADKLGQDLKKRFEAMVIVGIGGSSLGGRVLAQVAQANNVHFVDNVDAVEFESLFKKLSFEKTCWLFISKSGTTIETLTALEFIDQAYQEKKVSFHDKCVAITENKPSSLYNWAQQNKIPQLEIPLDVGGRFSVLTAVGLLPAAFMGMNISKMQKAAASARDNHALIADLMAVFTQSFQDEKWITLFWYYCSRASFLGLWFQQLWAESLGKKLDRQEKPAPRASTPMSAVGATDQHSILQQVMEGAKDKLVVFHRFEDGEQGQHTLKKSQFPETQTLLNKTMGTLLRAEAIATEDALRSNGITTLCLKTKVLNDETVTYYMMLLEMVVAGMGESMDINAFDQPGVELGKRLAKNLLNKA